ncbi:MAG: tRNA uridine-5-carboxymethylaminomethyl(34) synthesis GTPase MnmE [Verrucomicrobia bacterium]|nr:tRNA uridine-5-carboxymethylaminomethyl(34) synthesis GTPase MnmE [Verrucomicrobiota bacterium]
MSDVTVSKNPGDTIAAIATAPGEAGIAVVRVSGSRSLEIADQLFRGRRKPGAARAGTFLHGFIQAPGSKSPADEVVLLIYRAPHSYTREDVVEIQGHGGSTCARRILAAVLNAGARLAEPGEFTKLAFLNGRMDLVQAEAVADLIRAKSDRAATAAVEQLRGELSARFNRLYDGLVNLAADIEATLDFVEDELPESTMPTLRDELSTQRVLLESLLATWEEGHWLREGALTVITGKPNVGKSTLLNRLLGSERAIVTDIPGTTRDSIEEQLVLAGVPLRLIDTAGLRETDSPVEREGIRRARDLSSQADLHIHMLDITKPLDDVDRATIEQLPPERTLLVLNKCDLRSAIGVDDLPPGYKVLTCSLLDTKGVNGVREALTGLLAFATEAPAHAAISERHRSNVQSALDELNESQHVLNKQDEADTPLAAQHIRIALTHLGEVTGRVYSDELLDRVFSRFCIGK